MSLIGEVAPEHLRGQVESAVAHLHALDLGGLTITKPGSNPQTARDLAADRNLKDCLPNILPVPIMSEEDPVAMLGTSGLWWVIDPIDGTINDFAGLEICSSTSVALVDVTQMCAVLGVVRHRRNDGPLFSAIAEQGAYKNGEQLCAGRRYINPRHDAYRIVSFGIPGDAPSVMDRMSDALRRTYKAGWDTRQGGSACIDICNVADGTWSAFFEYGLHFWDFAAAVLIAKEAGCEVRIVPAASADPERQPYTFDILVARNKSVLSTIAEFTDIRKPGK